MQAYSGKISLHKEHEHTLARHFRITTAVPGYSANLKKNHQNCRIMIFAAKIISSVIVLTISFNALLIHLVFNWDMTHLHKENGLLENLQASALLLTALALAINAYFSDKSQRFYSLVGAVLCFSFFLRELDFKSLDLPSVVVYFGSGIRKKMLISFLWFSLLGYGALNYKTIDWRFCNAFYSEKLFLTLPLGGILLLLAGLFDSKIIVTSRNQFFEELLELNGYLLIMAAAMLLIRQLNIRMKR